MPRLPWFWKPISTTGLSFAYSTEARVCELELSSNGKDLITASRRFAEKRKPHRDQTGDACRSDRAPSAELKLRLIDGGNGPVNICGVCLLYRLGVLKTDQCEFLENRFVEIRE